MGDTKRLYITLPRKIWKLIEKEAAKREISESRVAYEYLLKGINISGHSIAPPPLKWGGKRKGAGRGTKRTKTTE